MRKIGILTYFWAENPGTFLQAQSMLAAVQKRFPDCRVELIDFKVRTTGFRLRKAHVHLPRLYQEYRRHRMFQECRRKHLVFSPEGLITHDREAAADFIDRQGYDLIVVGADTVLQLLPEYCRPGQLPIYWLPPRLKCRKAVFSASAHSLTCEDLDDRQRSAMSESLNAFDLVGVRDDVTYALVESLGLEDRDKLRKTPDPTICFSVDSRPIDRLLGRKRINLSGPTLGVNLPRKSRLAEDIIRHYRAKGFRVVSLTYRRSADHEFPGLSPFEWAGIYRYFRLTVTDRFHGSMFSLKSGRPVVAVETAGSKLTPRGQSKRRSLLREFGLEQTHHVDESQVTSVQEALATLDSAMDNFDAEAIRQRVRQLQGDFHAFLDRVAGLMA